MACIVYLPLDERPCNAKYPAQIAAITDLELVSPPPSLLGVKKTPANTETLARWLIENAERSNDLIVSLDMLVYGGIVPSRLHHLTAQECRVRLETIAECKRRNPSLRIYANNLIMRAPAYSSSDEEPDYYARHGAELARYGWLQDKSARDGLTDAERLERDRLVAELPADVLSDFIGRRRINAEVNRLAIDMVRDGSIDFLIIPLDDNAKYGYSSSEQRELLSIVREYRLLDRVHVYPGADEVGCTLFARVFCEIKGYRPEVYIRHSSTAGPFVIPKYEDRSLGESLKCQISAAGGFIGDRASEADFVLMVNSPPVGQADMAETTQAYGARHAAYFSEMNYREFALAINRYADKGLTVALADVATCNGSDEPLMQLLSESKLLPRIAAYAGWNTSGNTLGTVISHAIVESYYRQKGGDRSSESVLRSEAFYWARLLEDWGYQARIRSDVAGSHLAALGGNYFDVSAVHDEVCSLIRDKFDRFIEAELADSYPGRLRLERVYLPWKRMFEVGFEFSCSAE